MCVGVLLARVSSEVRRRYWIPETGVTDGFEPLYGCWELNPPWSFVRGESILNY